MFQCHLSMTSNMGLKFAKNRNIFWCVHCIDMVFAFLDRALEDLSIDMYLFKFAAISILTNDVMKIFRSLVDDYHVDTEVRLTWQLAIRIFFDWNHIKIETIWNNVSFNSYPDHPPRAYRGLTKISFPNPRWPGKFYGANAREPGTESLPNTRGLGLKVVYK